LELEEAMLGLEDQLAETEEALGREQGALARERADHSSLKRTIAREGAIVQKRLTASTSASASASASRKTKSFTSMTSDTEGYTSIDDTGDEAKGGAPGGVRHQRKASLSQLEEGGLGEGRGKGKEKDLERERRGGMSRVTMSLQWGGTPGRVKTSTRRPKPLIISENASSGGGSKYGRTGR